MAPRPQTRIDEDIATRKATTRSRSISPASQTCLLRQSPKPKRKIRQKPAPTRDQVQAQIAARIVQLTAPPQSAAPNAPKVNSNAVLNSTKIARLTTKIAQNEVEVARLEKEYADAKAALEHEEKIQAAARLSLQLKERCDVLVKKVESGELSEAEVMKERDAIVAQMAPVSQALTKLSKTPSTVSTMPIRELAKLKLKDEVD